MEGGSTDPAVDEACSALELVAEAIAELNAP